MTLDELEQANKTAREIVRLGGLLERIGDTCNLFHELDRASPDQLPAGLTQYIQERWSAFLSERLAHEKKALEAL